MEVKLKQKTPNKNPYDNLSFWEEQIINDKNLWEGYFDDKPITKSSKIIYTGILDLDKDILQCGWAVYPNTQSLLGFLQYVYLPTAFFIWFDNKSDSFDIPISDLDTAISEILQINKFNLNINSVNLMKEAQNFISGLWSDSSNLISIKFKNFCDTFNNTWNDEPNKKLFLKIFESPCDIYNFVKDSMEYDAKGVIEEDISLTLSSLKFACENTIDEPLLNNRFIDILNTNAPILF